AGAGSPTDAPLRPAAQRKSAGRKPVGMAPASGEQAMKRLVAAGLVLCAAGAVAIVSGQQAAGTAVFTAEQAAAGRAAYQANCASCHMPDLGGRNEAPPLAGVNFMNTWGSRTTRDLFDYMSTTMPPSGSTL